MFSDNLRKFILKPSETTPIGELFFSWLLRYVLLALILSFIASFFMETLAVRKEFHQLADAKIDEGVNQWLAAQRTKNKLIEAHTEYLRSTENAIAEIIRLNPDILKADYEKSDAQEKGLGELAKRLQIAEINVSDGNGYIIAAYPSNSLGVSFKEGNKHLMEFMRLLDPNDAPPIIIQPVRESFSEPGAYLLYAGIKRTDAPGFIQIGVPGEWIRRYMGLSSVTNFVTTNMGNGFFGIFKNGRLITEFNGLEKLPLEDLDLEDTETTEKIESVFLNGRLCLIHAELKRLYQDPSYGLTDDDKLLVDDLLGDELAAETGEHKEEEKEEKKEVEEEDAGGSEDDSQFIFIAAMPQTELFKSRRLMFACLIVVNFFVLLITFLMLSYFIKRFIVSSVYKINRSLKKITNGNLEEKVNVKTSKEFTDLSNGVNTTVGALKSAMDEVKRRVEEELRLAQKIQEAALPDLTSRYSREKCFDVYAVNRPMHLVGGDMYDFFYIDEKRLVFYVADVSGHGVAASLFMMKTMALVKNLALSGISLADVVTATNHFLSENNTTMFVTGFFCELDLSTGQMTYVNAGHNPPFIRRNEGTFMPIKPHINLILGVTANLTYESATMQLDPGDEFMLYTDGITEATADNIGCFEASRALETLNAVPQNKSAKETTQELLDAVDRFTGNAEPSDDETVLFFKMKKYGKLREFAECQATR